MTSFCLYTTHLLMAHHNKRNWIILMFISIWQTWEAFQMDPMHCWESWAVKTYWFASSQERHVILFVLGLFVNFYTHLYAIHHTFVELAKYFHSHISIITFAIIIPINYVNTFDDSSLLLLLGIPSSLSRGADWNAANWPVEPFGSSNEERNILFPPIVICPQNPYLLGKMNIAVGKLLLGFQHWDDIIRFGDHFLINASQLRAWERPYLR